MKTITLEELLEAGCHFGHQVARQNPKARDFVFEARDGVHIIDLAMTKEGLEAAAAYVSSVAAKGGSLLVVGSKRQAVPVLTSQLARVREELSKKNIPDNLFSVTARWIGGTLTNREEVSKNYKKLEEYTANLKDEFVRSRYTKKELVLMEREKEKLESLYSGVANMYKRPDALFIIDTHFEDLAVKEAKRTGLPIVGIVDTNADPDGIEYVVPANDDAAGSLELLIGYMLDAWIEGRENEGKMAAAKIKEDEAAAAKEVEKAEKEEKKAKAEADKSAKKAPAKKASKKAE